jgi:hypothetical protein
LVPLASGATAKALPARMRLTGISCDGLMGSTICTINFYSVEHEAGSSRHESSFDLEGQVREGKVIAASVENFAG